MTIQSKVGQSRFIVSLGRGKDSEFWLDKIHDARSIYQQIADGIESLIERGYLPDGSRLPTVRALALRADVTRVTIQRAYDELKSRGLADATIGKGTFVTKPQLDDMEPVELFPGRMTPDRVMADLGTLKERPGLISLAMAEPDLKLAPAREFTRLFRNLEEDAERLLSYGPYQGDLQLRRMLAGLLMEKGIETRAEEIIITSGVTQGLSLAVAVLTQPGDKVLVEHPTYLGFLSLLRSYGLIPIGIPTTEEGPSLDALEKLIEQERPRLYYSIPSFQNPVGFCMPQPQRQRLLQLAKKHNLTIIEDDTYGHLSYDNAPVKPLKAGDAPQHVVYLNSFSKLLFPGLRVGYMVPPLHLRERLMSFLRCRELCGSPLIQQALTTFLRRGGLHEHLRRVLPEYKQRRDVLLESLAQAMPDGVRWSQPQGGFCCWLTLPEEGNFEHLYKEALSRGMAFTPGSVFFENPETTRHLRICFSKQEPKAIKEAIFILGDLIKETLIRPSLEPQINAPSIPIM